MLIPSRTKRDAETIWARPFKWCPMSLIRSKNGLSESPRSLSIAQERSLMFALVCSESLYLMIDSNADLFSLVELVRSPEYSLKYSISILRF